MLIAMSTVFVAFVGFPFLLLLTMEMVAENLVFCRRRIDNRHRRPQSNCAPPRSTARVRGAGHERHAGFLVTHYHFTALSFDAGANADLIDCLLLPPLS